MALFDPPQRQLFEASLADASQPRQPQPSGAAKPARAYLKWAGGKSRILDRIFALLPQGRRLIEPFAGSAVVAINATRYESVLACDSNTHLIAVHCDAKARPEELIDEARLLFQPANNTQQAYLRLREEYNTIEPSLRRSALFIYLNRHGFNGLCRFNSNGRFNVPFGRYKAPNLPDAEIRTFSQRAARISFEVADFEPVMDASQPGDVIYCDPPYVPLSATASFTGYAKDEFGPEEQRRLAAAARRCAARGVPVVISNHDTAFTRDLYWGATIAAFPVQRMISCDGSNRWAAREILATFNA